jgi:putative colanic acid biosynthesis acetyltransferase WcaF
LASDSKRIRSRSAADELDIGANRLAPNWSGRELLGRALWEIVRVPLFAWTPRPFWAWRRGLLRLFGARIGRDVRICSSVQIAVPWTIRIDDEASVGDGAILYGLGPIVIGAQATVSQHAHLCAGTHDYRTQALPLVKSSITIGPGAWICADAFVGPDVTIGQFAILGARGVAVADVPPWTIAAGNPARPLRPRPRFAPRSAA